MYVTQMALFLWELCILYFNPYQQQQQNNHPHYRCLHRCEIIANINNIHSVLSAMLLCSVAEATKATEAMRACSKKPLTNVEIYATHVFLVHVCGVVRAAEWRSKTLWRT